MDSPTKTNSLAQQSIYRLTNIPPALAVFLASVLLSLLAIGTSGTLNRDGMLYVEAARMFDVGGWGAARDAFPWPFLSVLMAVISRATSLEVETAGHTLNVLFMAGACSLTVACSARLYPKTAWFAALTILAVPGLNDYRNELLREYGYWFFVMLAFWLALQWAETPSWSKGLLIQATLVCASLFRPEALALLPGLLIWQVIEAPKREKAERVLMLSTMLAIGTMILLVLYANGLLPSRLAADFGRLNIERFIQTARSIEPGLPEFARENASVILLFGSLAIIPIKFIKMAGPFIIPFLFAANKKNFVQSQVLGWAFLAHLSVLAVFVTDLHFLAGRYIATLFLFSTPLIAFGLFGIVQRWPRLKYPAIILPLVLALSNAISLTPSKSHFVEAGHWLAQKSSDSSRIYVESARSAYYAGWRFSGRPIPAARGQLTEGRQAARYDLFVFEVSRKETGIANWMQANGLREIKRFEDRNGDAVIIAEPLEPIAQRDNDTSTSRMRAKTGSTE